MTGIYPKFIAAIPSPFGLRCRYESQYAFADTAFEATGAAETKVNVSKVKAGNDMVTGGS